MKKPNYGILRDNFKFHWYVNSTPNILLELMDISYRDFNLNPEAGIELFRKGRPILRELYGPDVTIKPPVTPPVSYGHINGLGAELLFPEDGEVGHAKICDTLEQGVDLLQKKIDFTSSGMAIFYINYQKKLQKVFPDEKIAFLYTYEGPITTAYALRGDKVFYDPYDNPKLFKKFMQLIVKSTIDFYTNLWSKANDLPERSDVVHLADDISSMFSPSIWDQFVLPYWELYYDGLGTAKHQRTAHIEDLRVEQIPFLEKIELFDWDPSVSPKINPEIIAKNCRIPFGWRLCNFHYPELNCQNVRDFVFKAVADGAGYIWTCLADGMCDDESVRKVHTFIDSCKHVKKMFDAGATRIDILNEVSDEGKIKFWKNW